MSDIRIESWGAGDLPLLEQLLADPVMTLHLGGPESAEKIAERHGRYEAADSGQFRIVESTTGVGVGWVGFWERDWRGEGVYEMGWAVLPGFQGRGIASAAAAEVVEEARREGRRRYLLAYPSVENAPSNAICRKLGFTLLGESDYEYPPGHWMRCNDWRLDLREG